MIQDKMSSCCPICYRTTEARGTRPSRTGFGGVEEGEGEVIEQIFFRSLEGYLARGEDEDNPSDMERLPLDQLFGRGRGLFCSCGECLELMEGFCDNYNQLKTIELELNRKVERLRNVMNGAEGIPSRVSYFLEVMGRANVGDSAIKWKKALIEKCSMNVSAGTMGEVLADDDDVDGDTGMGMGSSSIQSTPRKRKLTGSDWEPHAIPVSKAKMKEEGDGSADYDFDIEIPQEDSGDEHEIKIEPATGIGHNSLDDMDPLEIQQASSTSSNRQDPLGGQDNLLIFKCPGCSYLFQSMKALLDHRKSSKRKTSWNQFCNPSSTANVEVFQIPHGNYLGADLKKLVNVTNPPPFAKIELQQDIFICQKGGCGGVVMYNPVDLIEHRKLHGSFPCQFCQVTECYAPNLALHEQLNHAPFMEEGDRDRSKIFNCPRCDSETGGSDASKTFIRHHLEHHLNLVFYDEPVCPICPHQLFLPSNQLEKHLKTHHDLTKVPPEDVKRCSRNNCRSYFLTLAQLEAHQLNCSYNPPETGFRLKCPDCCGLFQFINDFLVHRRDSVACGGESYHPATSVRLDVLGPQPPPPPISSQPKGGTGSRTRSKIDQSKFSHRLATIDLPQAMFSCDICQTIVYSSEDLESHKKLHGSFPCNSCAEEITFAPDFPFHDLHHSANTLEGGKDEQSKRSGIQCPRCDFKCGSGGGGRKAYVHHYLEHHLSLTLNEPVCPICNTNPDVSNPVRAGEHFQRFHDLSNVTTPEGVKRCSVTNCQAYFLSGPQLQHHLKKRHNLDAKDRKHKCKDCNQAFALSAKLRDHRRRCHRDKIVTIPCVFENCPKVFESKEEIQRHIVGPGTVHEPLDDPSKKVPCPRCEASFSGADPILLIQHLKSQHGPEKRFYICDLCGKSFRDNSHLNEHLFTHAGPSGWEFTCNVCSKKCISKSRLEDHMRAHNNGELSICELCGQTFAQPGHLKIHVKAKHAGSRDHQLQRGGDGSAPKKKPNGGRNRNHLASSSSSRKKEKAEDVSADEDESMEELRSDTDSFHANDDN